MWNFKYSIFDIQHLIFDIQYFFQVLETVRGGSLVDLITVYEMCYKSANVANVADLANVLQIGIGRILFLLESTKLSQPDKIIGIRAINIVFIIDIVEPNGFKGLFTYYVSRRGGVGGMANADHC